MSSEAYKAMWRQFAERARQLMAADYVPPPPPPPPTKEELAERARVRRHLEKQEAADRLTRHRALSVFHTNKRRAARLQRTPAWGDLDAMRAIYNKAAALTRSTGVPHTVDHVIPLQGKLVSGLHVHNNLQILTGSENSKKRNHFEVEA